jgi:hypothetical protein
LLRNEFIEGGNPTATTPSTNVEQLDAVTFVLEWNTGDVPNIDVFIEARMREQGNNNPNAVTGWVDISAGQSINISGASGNHVITIKCAELRLTEIRARLARNAGEASISLTVAGGVVGA